MIRSDDIYTVGETGFMVGMIQSGMVVTGTNKRGKPKSVQPENREWITAIQAINSEGWPITPFIIGVGQYHLANWYRESNLLGDWAIETTRNGCPDNETGLEWLKPFEWRIINRSVGVYRLLILDGYESHHSPESERYCEQDKIIRLCMPPHLSHLLQPLDVGCFDVSTNAYGQEIEHFIRYSVTHISKTQLFLTFYATFRAIMTEKNIKPAFRGAGLVPLDPKRVVVKPDVQPWPPTPPEEEAEPLTPWVSKTPNTVLEAQSQPDYPERRVTRHKSSPPEPILEATRSSSKGTKTVVHKVTLLEVRVKDLEQASGTLRRHLRANRNRLQTREVTSGKECSEYFGLTK